MAKKRAKKAHKSYPKPAYSKKRKISKALSTNKHPVSAKKIKKQSAKHNKKHIVKDKEASGPQKVIIDKYSYKFNEIPVDVLVYRIPKNPSKFYELSISHISHTTQLILEEIRLKLIDIIDVSSLEEAEQDATKVDESIKTELKALIDENFSSLDDNTKKVLYSYSVSNIIGLGEIEILRSDYDLEEIAVNKAKDPIWVYHKKHGWLKTNIIIDTEDKVLQFSNKIGRNIGREITTLRPLMDANLDTGDRVNATLMPVTVNGNSITLRKFSHDPWTITRFLKNGTISPETASLLWLAFQYELSTIIVGGTASGKTSTLNALANFFPPNQRIISIEDTRELMLPSYLHWVPMLTRIPNAEGKGGIEMEDLLVNSLRMRPDRILVGEIRRKEQAETLLEAIHTGHSCYATFHANNAHEAITRFTNPPINVPKIMMNAISLFVVQYRNRRTGLRRTVELAEITDNGEINILSRLDAKKDKMLKVNKSKYLLTTLKNFTGLSDKEINHDLNIKNKVLKYMIKRDLSTIEKVGEVMSMYYSDLPFLTKLINKNKPI